MTLAQAFLRMPFNDLLCAVVELVCLVHLTGHRTPSYGWLACCAIRNRPYLRSREPRKDRASLTSPPAKLVQKRSTGERVTPRPLFAEVIRATVRAYLTKGSGSALL